MALRKREICPKSSPVSRPATTTYISPELSLQSCLDIHGGGLVVKLFVGFVIRLLVIWFWCFRVYNIWRERKAFDYLSTTVWGNLCMENMALFSMVSKEVLSDHLDIIISNLHQGREIDAMINSSSKTANEGN